MPLNLFGRRRLFVPEVVQTSSMDCGPASLKCMLEGFGITASYGRLREACQTEVDGTSIDTMEEVAVQLGLEAEQVMIPVDHLLLPGSEPLPALVVVRRPPNATHFLVAWRRTGRFMQLMDPATGRHWVSASKFLEEAYVHTMPVAVEALHLVAGFGLSAWLLVGYVSRTGESGGLLLFAYWVLNLPVLGQEVGLVARQYPGFLNATLRMLEPLGALEETEVDDSTDTRSGTIANAEEEAVAAEVSDIQVAAQTDLIIPKVTGSLTQVEEVTIAAGTLTLDSPLRVTEPNGDEQASHASTRGLPVVFEDVTVRAAGHTILEGIDLAVEACEHVAVVGASGAGKSSLVGILLGWHRTAAGRVYVGGEQLGGRRLEQLRRETAWVDPTVQLWNQTFIENIRYGSGAADADSLSRAVKLADLIDVLEKLPDGLQTPLGEGGALVSGGQGQRVRLRSKLWGAAAASRRAMWRRGHRRRLPRARAASRSDSG